MLLLRLDVAAIFKDLLTLLQKLLLKESQVLLQVLEELFFLNCRHLLRPLQEMPRSQRKELQSGNLSQFVLDGTYEYYSTKLELFRVFYQ